MDVEATANDSAAGSGEAPEPDDAPLPVAYGSNRLELMVRDPAWAHAYWDISIDRINDVVGARGGGRACLRLIAFRTGRVLAECAVRAERGSHGFALPEADRWYRVELAIMRNDRWVVLARSNVVHAPPKTPRAAREPTFVSRAQEPRSLAEGPTLGPAGHGGHFLSRRLGESPQGVQTAVRRGPAGAPASMAADQPQVGSELRLAQRGSEARLVRREPVHVRFVIARNPDNPEPVAAALRALAANVWFGRDPVHVLAAGNALVRALADAGISFGPAVAILDPPGREMAAPDPGTRDTSAPSSEGYTATANRDGSITVIGPDGSSITYNPVQFGSVDGPGTRSAAAVIEVRHAS